MPSLLAHVAPALALAPAFVRPGVPRRLVWWGAFGAIAPDLDVLTFALGVPYAHPLGHRGLWHSLPFAALLAIGLAWFALRPRDGETHCRHAWLYLFLCVGSHGVLDAATNGGLGVALLAPFDATRFFFPFRPIEVSPLGVSAFLSARGLAVVGSELRWVWLPCLAVGAGLLWRRRRAGVPLRSRSGPDA